MEKKQTKEEEKVELLERELKERDEALADTEGAEAIERHLKNEAYAFLLANGLLDKFLEFRSSSYHRTKQEDSIYLLAMSSDQGGLWIDLG